MPIDPAQLKKDLYPIPSYSDLSKRLQVSLSYSFVQKAYAHTMQQAQEFARGLLGDDPRQRYGAWLASLQQTFAALGQAGVKDYADLVGRTGDEAGLETLAGQAGLSTGAVVGVLKYLLYWVLPGKKDLNQLILPTDAQKKANNVILKQHGLRSNLDLLERGNSLAGRQALAAQTGLPLEYITEMVHRADYSRMPWFNGKTINHFMGAGYPTLARLAQAEIPEIVANMTRYGQSIGKNLKFGVEADSGGIVARVLPRVIED
jgi:Domain of unknown function (DUF4332)